MKSKLAYVTLLLLLLYGMLFFCSFVSYKSFTISFVSTEMILCFKIVLFLLNFGDVATCFKPDGMLSSEVGSVGIYLISEHFRGSKKMVCPYWVTVSYIFFFTSSILLSFVAPFAIFINVLFVLYACSIRFIMEIYLLV